MSQTATAPASGRIRWTTLITIVSAAILLGTETVGASLAFGWAMAGWLGLGDIGTRILEVARPDPRRCRRRVVLPPRRPGRVLAGLVLAGLVLPELILAGASAGT